YYFNSGTATFDNFRFSERTTSMGIYFEFINPNSNQLQMQLTIDPPDLISYIPPLILNPSTNVVTLNYSPTQRQRFTLLMFNQAADIHRLNSFSVDFFGVASNVEVLIHVDELF